MSQEGYNGTGGKRNQSLTNTNRTLFHGNKSCRTAENYIPTNALMMFSPKEESLLCSQNYFVGWLCVAFKDSIVAFQPYRSTTIGTKHQSISPFGLKALVLQLRRRLPRLLGTTTAY